MVKTVRILTICALLAIAVAGWMFFAPRPLGGPVSYVVTDGISMQPRLHAGDLVVLHDQPSYEVGDVAAYESHSLGRIVLHRIVETTPDGRFIFKGDNNDFVDEDRPGTSEILGAKWLLVPQGGKALSWVGEPRNAALFVAVIALFLLGGFGSRRRKGRHRKKKQRPRLSPSHQTRRSISPLVVIAGVIAVVALVLGAVAYSRPDQSAVSRKVTYESTGTFSYRASVPKSSVYQDGLVTTGEPLFLEVVDRAQLRFEYRFVTEGAHEVRGSGDVVVELSDPSGWKHTQFVTGNVSFEGDNGTLTGVIDLRRLRALVESFTALTRLQQPAYSLTIQPRLQIEGQVEGQTFSQDFNPILGFDFDPLRARLSAPKVDPALDPTTSVDPLHPTASGAVSALDSIPSSISAGPLELPMTVVRNAALGGLAFAFLLALIGSVRRRAVGEPNEIARQYRTLLLDAVAATHPVERRAIGVKTIGELARLAERYERFIVHEEEEGVHTYSVEEDGVVYWYQAIAGDDRARGLDSDAPLTNLHPIREAESSHRDIRIGS